MALVIKYFTIAFSIALVVVLFNVAPPAKLAVLVRGWDICSG